MPKFCNYENPHTKKQWSITIEGYNPEEERHREALFALGNGYFVTRAATTDAIANDIHYPGTYRAGLYNRLESQVKGETVEDESLVNLPNWLPLTFRIEGGEWFSIDKVEVLAYQQTLHLRDGVLQREIRFQDAKGRKTTLHEHRFVSMAQPHLAGLHLEFIPENWSGKLEICSAIDGRVINNNVKRYEPYEKKHLEKIETGELQPSGIWLTARTSQSKVEVGLAARTQVFPKGAGVNAKRCLNQESKQIQELIEVSVSQGEGIEIEKIIALYTSGDPAIACYIETPQKDVLTAPRFDALLDAHQHAWARLWMRCELEFDPIEYLPTIRLHIFHILQTISPHTADLDAGLPPRGWHGEGYRGQIFWDEVFVLPFLIYRFPAVAREILLYRYRRINAARAMAQEKGYKGAMFPWRSASNGHEETPRYQFNLLSGEWTKDHTYLQRHISAIVAHTVWVYYTITDDLMFLCDYGAELLIEIARFWASIATYNPEYERYEICGVMGPDEYHTAYSNAETPGINNNSYTNLMAVWTLCRAKEVLDLLPASRNKELCQWLKLSQDELDHWDTLSRKMRVVFYEDGTLGQFEGFNHLKEIDWQECGHKRINWILEAKGDDVNHYQVAKQADVAMLFFLFSETEIEALLARLGYSFDSQQMKNTINYHYQRTSHESSLSRFVYAGALSQLNTEKSWHFFTEALATDLLTENSKDASSGVHLGVMAGTLYLLQHHYLGLEVKQGTIHINPSFPSAINHLKVSFQLKLNDFEIEKIGDSLKVTAAPQNSSSIPIIYQGEEGNLKPGTSVLFSLF